MADNGVVQDIVTKFLLDTCRLRQDFNFDTAHALNCYVDLAAQHPPDKDEVDIIPVITGSTAEFYIEPMLSCVGDIDIMAHRSDQLAIPLGTVPPTQLPGEFDSVVLVYEIVDSEFPGYVNLVSSYLLTENIEDVQYNAEQCERLYCGRHFADVSDEMHGPAVVYEHSIPYNEHYERYCLERIAGSRVSQDSVYCMHCMSWPLQAADWPTRHRDYDWPDSATVDRVVSNGCDVVRVAHRQCRQHEWMNKYQCRLSFSRAEIVLLNSWMPVQQIVYHVLRVFFKIEQLTNEDSMLSNYNIKTLMLWACELKPRSWWTDDLNFVRNSVELLHTLGVWLTDARCQHYFINDCNLFGRPKNSSSQQTASRLTSQTEVTLAAWFIENYIIRRCVLTCPSHVLRLFDDISTTTALQNAVSTVVHFKSREPRFDSYAVFTAMQCSIPCYESRYPLTVRWCLLWMRELSKIHQSLSVFYTASTFLHVAYKTTRNMLQDELLDVLTTICLQSNDVRRCRNARHSSVLSLSQAAKMMEVIANNSHSTVQLIEIELSKAYLYRALRCKDSDSDSIYCLANVYLAVLYYTTGQYQTAIDHCILVMRSQDHSQCSSHVVQGELLPKIDNNIDSVLGLVVFYQYVRTTALNQPRGQHVNVFSTELFALYIHTRCCLATQMSTSPQIYQHWNCFHVLSPSDIVITDLLLFKYANPTIFSTNDARQVSISALYACLSGTPGQLNTSELVELLQQSAVEHLTTYRQLVARDFGSVATIVTTDFEAMYAYKRGDYQPCLQLSKRNVHTLLGDRQIPWNGTLVAFPEFIQLMDDDIVSLTALTLIINPDCRLIRLDDDSFYVLITQLTLSLYLMTQCQMKLHHSVTSLIQTLHYIEVAHRNPFYHISTLDELLLKLTERKILLYTSRSLDH